MNSLLTGVAQQSFTPRKPLKEEERQGARPEPEGPEAYADMNPELPLPQGERLRKPGTSEGHLDSFHYQGRGEADSEGQEDQVRTESWPSYTREESPCKAQGGRLFYDTTAEIQSQFTQRFSGKRQSLPGGFHSLQEQMPEQVDFKGLKNMVNIEYAQYSRGFLYSKAQLAGLLSQMGTGQPAMGRRVGSDNLLSRIQDEHDGGNERSQGEYTDRYTIGRLWNMVTLLETPSSRGKLDLVA
jgi:hypothetical protein